MLLCAAGETDVVFPELVRAVTLWGEFRPNGPCGAYLMAASLFDRGQVTQACDIDLDPGVLPGHFQRFNAWMIRAWCLFVSGQRDQDVLDNLNRDALYEGERRAARKIGGYTSNKI